MRRCASTRSSTPRLWLAKWCGTAAAWGGRLPAAAAGQGADASKLCIINMLRRSSPKPFPVRRTQVFRNVEPAVGHRDFVVAAVAKAEARKDINTTVEGFLRAFAETQSPAVLALRSGGMSQDQIDGRQRQRECGVSRGGAELITAVCCSPIHVYTCRSRAV